MADRVVKVTLLAEIAKYVGDISKAQQATQQLASETSKASKAEKIAAQDAAKSAQIRKQSMETVAKVAIGVGGAITAVGLAALKTGIQYNTLQQTTRAALKTLLGSAQAANAQMDKLDAFARTSPFSKQVFITAQQQLIGFGMEAKKVIPTLDAVQNAVAATGGSSQQLSEITFVLAQIQAAGKITATDLMQLGQRGIDAATLIGSQMGKTGAQIRQDITAGSLSASDALDALTKGMAERFAGAAANVKQTFSGAMDRVKAAWRDFSSVLAEPLVGKNGGGALVDLLNWTADVMRAFIALPEPVKLTASAIAGVTGAILLAGGTAVLAVPKIVAFRVALETLKTQSPLAASAIGQVSSAMRALPYIGFIAGLAAASGQLADVTLEATGARKTLDGLNDSFGELGTKKTIDDALGFSGSTLLKNATSFGWISDVNNQASGLLDTLKGWNVVGRLIGGSTGEFRHNLEELDKTMAGMVAKGDTKSAAEAFTYLASKTDGSKESLNKLKAMFPEYAKAQKDAAQSTKDLGDNTADTAAKQDDAGHAASRYSAALGGVNEMTEEAVKTQQKWIEQVAGSSAAFIDIQSAYDGLVEANKKTAESTAKATKSGKDSWEDFYDGSSVSIDKWIKVLQGQVAAQANWQTNMTKLAGRVSEDTLTELAKLGPKGAPLVAQLVNASDAELAKLDSVTKQRSEQATGTFATTLDQAKPIIAAAAAQLGKKGADEIAEKLGSGAMSIEQVIKKYNLKLKETKLFIWADTSHASSAVDTFIRHQNGRTITIRVRADGISTLQNSVSRMVATSRAGGGPVPGTPSHTDNTLIYAASGEFITRTAQAQKPGNRRVLEWMNAGGDFGGGYANGGFVQPRYASNTTAPVVNVAAPSLEGAVITGRMRLDPDGFVTLIDGRISAAMPSAVSVTSQFGSH
ncbi:tape measure protein [Microbacterium terrisoli]|uniref:tape measure protein n=1 Tax=Microbacterium terrisoli TaxID=3242192 RepID=UPI0028063B11|nr:tape measure protein [Microbacterium protaetiae]